MENKHPIGDLMSTTMQKIREMDAPAAPSPLDDGEQPTQI